MESWMQILHTHIRLVIARTPGYPKSIIITLAILLQLICQNGRASTITTALIITATWNITETLWINSFHVESSDGSNECKKYEYLFIHDHLRYL